MGVMELKSRKHKYKGQYTLRLSDKNYYIFKCRACHYKISVDKNVLPYDYDGTKPVILKSIHHKCESCYYDNDEALADLVALSDKPDPSSVDVVETT